MYRLSTVWTHLSGWRAGRRAQPWGWAGVETLAGTSRLVSMRADEVPPADSFACARNDSAREMGRDVRQLRAAQRQPRVTASEPDPRALPRILERFVRYRTPC
jgi:hypothetical protein